MMRILFIGKILGLAVLLSWRAALPAAEFPPDRMFQTVEAAPGVYAFIAAATAGPIPSGNVVAIVGDDGVLVVDSGRFPTLAKRMIAAIRAKTDKPVRYLVHTHWHLDHIASDEVFRAAFPHVAIVTTDFTRRKIVEKQVPYLKGLVETDAGYIEYLQGAVAKGKRRDGSAISEESKRYLSSQVPDIQLESAELAGVAAVIPDLTFDHDLRIHLGTREVRIAFLGKGNTAGDTVVFVPDAKVAVTGDLLVSPTPYGYGCHPAAWIATLDVLMASGATVIVPGHGPVMHDWSYAKKVSALLAEVRRQVDAQVKQGATLEQAQERVDLSAQKKLFGGDSFEQGAAFDDFFVRSAVDRAFQEAKGEMAEE